MNFIIKLFLNAVSVVIVSYLLHGVHVSDFLHALILAALLALLNVSVKPLLIFLTIPATILTLGLFLLIVNALIIEIAAWIMRPEFTVDGFGWALLFSILLSLVNGIFDRLISNKNNGGKDDVQVFDRDGNRIA